MFCMCRSHDCQAGPASKWALAPRGESATLNRRGAAYEFKTAPRCCVLKEIGKRLGEVNSNDLLWMIVGKGSCLQNNAD